LGVATTWEPTIGTLVSYEISLTTILPYLSREPDFTSPENLLWERQTRLEAHLIPRACEGY
jgi:hypothetical protein